MPGLDGQHGDGQQQTGRVHQRAQHMLVFGIAAVVQAARPLQEHVWFTRRYRCLFTDKWGSCTPTPRRKEINHVSRLNSIICFCCGFFSFDTFLIFINTQLPC